MVLQSILPPFYRWENCGSEGPSPFISGRATYKLNSKTQEPECLTTVLHGFAPAMTLCRRLLFPEPNTEPSVVWLISPSCDSRYFLPYLIVQCLCWISKREHRIITPLCSYDIGSLVAWRVQQLHQWEVLCLLPVKEGISTLPNNSNTSAFVSREAAWDRNGTCTLGRPTPAWPAVQPQASASTSQLPLFFFSSGNNSSPWIIGVI